MRILAWVGVVFLTFLGLIYIVAFTGFGNALVKPFIEQKIREQTKLDATLSVFRVDMSSFDILLTFDRPNTIAIKGKHSLFSQTFNVDYNVALNYLESLQPLTQTPLKGEFRTQGNVVGDLKQIVLKGTSDVASSQTTYSVELKDFTPTKVVASLQGAKVHELLEMLGQPSFASSNLSAEIDFTSFDPQNLQGKAKIILSEGKINTQTMQKLYNVALPQTSFTSSTNVELQGENVDYVTALRSNLANIDSSGRIVPKNLGMDLIYSLNISELAVLQPITQTPLRGALNLSGEVKGDKANLIVRGESDVAASATEFEAHLKKFAPASLKANIKNLQLARLLAMLEQPHYTDGLFSAAINITDATMGKLKGEITTQITQGVLDSAYLSKTYAFASPMPKTAFHAKTHTALDGDSLLSKIDLDSDLAALSIKKAHYNMKDASIHSDYTLRIPDLNKLFFITDRRLKGSLAANGELKKAKDLELTIFSNIAEGAIAAKLLNDDFHADIKGVQTLKVLEMLLYPQIFKASLHATLDYNLAAQKGKFAGQLSEGSFTQNQIFDLVKKYAKTDMYKENFKGDVSASINKEHIVASLDLKSNTSAITTKDAKLNSATKQIDSDLTVVFNNNPVSATLKGDVGAPKVSIDLQKFMESKAGEKVQKEMNRLFKKLF
jgi:hypothetical protein